MIKLDVMFIMLGALIFFIVSLLAQINPPTEQEKQHRPGNVVASISWPAGADDVDMWLAAPGEPGVGYTNKSGKVWSLLRDDLGVVADSTPYNFESAYTRGIPDGAYGINLHCFKCRGPVVVHVELGIAGAGKFWTGVITVAPRQARTALRWRMQGGAFVRGSENQIYKKIGGA